MMTGCEQHNCVDNQYIIFIDLGEGSVNVTHISRKGIREWNGGSKIDLPPPFQEELERMKPHQ